MTGHPPTRCARECCGWKKSWHGSSISFGSLTHFSVFRFPGVVSLCSCGSEKTPGVVVSLLLSPSNSVPTPYPCGTAEKETDEGEAQIVRGLKRLFLPPEGITCQTPPLGLQLWRGRAERSEMHFPPPPDPLWNPWDAIPQPFHPSFCRPSHSVLFLFLFCPPPCLYTEGTLSEKGLSIKGTPIPSFSVKKCPHCQRELSGLHSTLQTGVCMFVCLYAQIYMRVWNVCMCVSLCVGCVCLYVSSLCMCTFSCSELHGTTTWTGMRNTVLSTASKGQVCIFHLGKGGGGVNRLKFIPERFFCPPPKTPTSCGYLPPLQAGKHMPIFKTRNMGVLHRSMPRRLPSTIPPR